MNPSGRVVLLTGASGGIGRATARHLAREGARLALFGRREGPLRTLQAEIESEGGQALATPGDVRVAADAERAVADAVSHFGGLDVVINNAGMGRLLSLEEATEGDVRELLEVNVLGTFRVTRAALAALRARGRGAIINVGSFAGTLGAPYYSFYGASKFALAGMTEGWRRELAPLGIDVSLIIPAAVETPLLDRLNRARALGLGPAGTVLAPEVVARGIVAVLRRPRPALYLPGWNRWLGLLNMFMPRLSDRIVTRLFRYPPRTA